MDPRSLLGTLPFIAATLAAAYIRKKNIFQDRRLIFVGNQQILILYTLLFVLLISSLIRLFETPSILLLLGVALLGMSLLFTKLNSLFLSSITFFSGAIIYILNTYQKNDPVSILIFVVIIYVSFIFLSLFGDNRELKKSWSEVEADLMRAGSSQTEIEVFKNYWEKNKKF